MLFRRVAFIGVMFAAISAGVIQLRLMNASASREIHKLVAQHQVLQRQSWQQEMELARLRTPRRIEERLTATGSDFLAPDAKRVSDLPPRKAEPSTSESPADDSIADGPVSSESRELATPDRQPGGSTRSWPNHSTTSNPRRAAR